MEQFYAFSVSVIQFVQVWFEDWDEYLEMINNFSNPHNILEVLFPLVSIVDSVFASQLLLCLAFGSWLNAVMKWWFLEDRPYWWVHETSFYTESQRPRLRQTRQTCETGPGSPSGHSAMAASVLLLIIMWISHVMQDRKCYIWWWKCAVYPIFATLLASVMLARVYVAAHFPHQCLLGALVGSFLAPALCIYVSDPYIWRYGVHSSMGTRSAILWHVFTVAVTVLISLLTDFGLTFCGWDPYWTIDLAYEWCEDRSAINLTTSPLFALVQSTANLLGWALAVTPAVAEYRHYTKNRSLIISALATAVTVYSWKHVEGFIDDWDVNNFQRMTIYFSMSTLKPIVLLRLVPSLSMWSFTKEIKNKIE